MSFSRRSDQFHPESDPYVVLGVTQDAKLAEIRSAHRKLVLRWYPDKVQDPVLKTIAINKFQKIQQAYELLSNETRRLQYDKQVKLFKLSKAMGYPKRVVQSTDSPTIPKHSAEKSHNVARESGGGAPIRKNATVFQINEWGAEVLPGPRISIPRAISRTKSQRSQGIQVIKGHISGIKSYAIPDTGAEFNIMAAEFAKEEGFSVDNEDPSKCQWLRMANGKYIKTVGVVEAKWKFASDPSQEWQITFHVLAGSVYDLILGGQFLFATQTMSHHKERLSTIPRPVQPLSVLRVNVLGSASRQVHGSLEGRQVNALPDSGSEPSLLSYEYAKRRGWLLRMKTEDRNLLQFADGSIEKTEGSLYVRWKFPSKTPVWEDPESFNVKFHILRGCSHNIILGQDILDESDAFLKHADAFLEVSSKTKASGLNLVIWLRKKKKKTETPPNHQSSTERNSPARLNTDLHIELQRRAEADRKLNRMPSGPDKDAAMDIEAQSRRTYDYSANLQRPSLDANSGESNASPPTSMRSNSVRPVRFDPL